jgi:prevent-host-death family protein
MTIGTVTMVMKLERITATQFKARCLRLLDEVAETHRPIEITKRGQVVARLEPLGEQAPDLKDSVTFHLPDDELIEASMGSWEVEASRRSLTW